MNLSSHRSHILLLIIASLPDPFKRHNGPLNPPLPEPVHRPKQHLLALEYRVRGWRGRWPDLQHGGFDPAGDTHEGREARKLAVAPRPQISRLAWLHSLGQRADDHAARAARFSDAPGQL